MLIELRIENLLLIERAELALDAGLNVITGETGAGKTMLAHAIDLLLGGKSRRGIVRPGAGEAYVEGLFSLPAGLLDRPEFADLKERLPDLGRSEAGSPEARVPEAGASGAGASGVGVSGVGVSEIALARRVTPDGRTRAYIEGRAATAADLRALGGALVSFYGQHEHRKLTLAGAQLATLDGFCGDAHRQRVAAAAAFHDRVRHLRQEAAELELVDGRRERELGLIEFELAEIEAVQPEVADEVALRAEYDRLRSVDVLRAAGESAVAALSDTASDASADGSGGAAGMAALAASQLAAAAGADSQLDALAARVDAISLELQDTAADLRSHIEGLAADPERLAFVEDRLDVYERLKRKHGGTVESVLAHAAHCREDRDRLVGSTEQIERVHAELDELQDQQLANARQITKSRRAAAPKLAAAVRERLADLALADASFEIAIESDASDLRPTGADSVEFLIAPNPGIAPTPLRETASGGELSRVMLALLTASGRADSHSDADSKDAAGSTDEHGSQTYVFDEIDAGIGGHTARAVGEQLRLLGATRQVICITHLPQVAAAAERHFQIEKSSAGGEARTAVNRLESRAVVDELCRMMGADGTDTGARKHARELLAAA